MFNEMKEDISTCSVWNKSALVQNLNSFNDSYIKIIDIMFNEMKQYVSTYVDCVWNGCVE